MLTKLGNAILLFINVKKSAGSLFTSGLLHNFTQLEVKEVFLTERTLHLKSFYSSNSKILM